MKKTVLLFLFIILVQSATADENDFTVVFDFGNGDSFERCYTCPEETYGPMPTGVNGSEVLFEKGNTDGSAVVLWIYYDGENWVSVSENEVPAQENHTLYAVWDEKTDEPKSGTAFEKTNERVREFLLKLCYILPAVTLAVLSVTVFKIKHTDR